MAATVKHRDAGIFNALNVASNMARSNSRQWHDRLTMIGSKIEPLRCLRTKTAEKALSQT